LVAPDFDLLHQVLFTQHHRLGGFVGPARSKRGDNADNDCKQRQKRQNVFLHAGTLSAKGYHASHPAQLSPRFVSLSTSK